MKRFRKDRKVEDIKQEKYVKYEGVEEENPRDQLEHETKGNYGRDH